MANVIIIMGATGTGKSTSIKTLNPKESIIINVLNKRLPFKGSQSIFNSENKNLFYLNSYAEVEKYLIAISEKAKQIKTVVIDDAIYLMRKEFMARIKEKGYDVYKELAANFDKLINTSEMLRNDLNVVLMFHVEPVFNGSIIESYKLATIGKLIDEKFNPIERVSVALFSMPKIENNETEYGFYTHLTSVNGAMLISKSPEGMFEEDFIPNDLQFVIDKMTEYYN